MPEYAQTPGEDHRVFEKQMLRIFEPKREEVTGGWRISHDEIYTLYSSPNIISVIKSRRIRCVGHLAKMEEYEKCIQNFSWKT
jgi:hypothetical protein